MRWLTSFPVVSSERPYIGDESMTRHPASKKASVTSRSGNSSRVSKVCQVPRPMTGSSSPLFGMGRVRIQGAQFPFVQVQLAPPEQFTVHDAQVTVQLAPSLQLMTPRSPTSMEHDVPPEQFTRASCPPEKVQFAPLLQVKSGRSPPVTRHDAEPEHTADES